MTDRISLAQLRADYSSFRQRGICQHEDPVNCDRCQDMEDYGATVLALVEAVEAAHRWQQVCRALIANGIAGSGYAMTVLGEIAGSPALARFDFGDAA